MTSAIKTQLQTGRVDLREALAAERTILADERTFLAYLRTAITAGISGASLLEFFRSTVLTQFMGGFLVVLAGLILVWGMMRFIKVKRLIPWAE